MNFIRKRSLWSFLKIMFGWWTGHFYCPLKCFGVNYGFYVILFLWVLKGLFEHNSVSLRFLFTNPNISGYCVCYYLTSFLLLFRPDDQQTPQRTPKPCSDQRTRSDPSPAQNEPRPRFPNPPYVIRTTFGAQLDLVNEGDYHG